MTVVVKEMFRTLQGEGRWAGTPSVFVRLAGCNLWSGRDEDRERDVGRNGAMCPMFCDTDFVGGEPLEVEELATRIHELASSRSGQLIQHVVFTGGEPLLQLNRHPRVLESVRRRFPFGRVRLAVETNGTVGPREEFLDRSWDGRHGAFDWICVSPKVSLKELRLRRGNELKVVFPSYDPLEYASLASDFDELLVSPEFPSTRGSLVEKDVLERAVAFCLEHPRWRLSVQQHKSWGVP